MSEKVRELYEKTEKNLIGGGIGGILKVLHKYMKTEVPQYYHVVKHAEGFDKALLPAVYGLVGALFIPDAPNWDDQISIAVADTLEGLADRFIFKEPYLILVDAKNIEGYNFPADATGKLYIDGVEQAGITVETDSNGHFKITLATELEAGKHDIVVIVGGKSAYLSVKV